MFYTSGRRRRTYTHRKRTPKRSDHKWFGNTTGDLKTSLTLIFPTVIAYQASAAYRNNKDPFYVSGEKHQYRERRKEPEYLVDSRPNETQRETSQETFSTLQLTRQGKQPDGEIREGATRARSRCYARVSRGSYTHIVRYDAPVVFAGRGGINDLLGGT